MTRTPDDVLTEIHGLRAELMRGPDVIRDLEVAAERAEFAHQLALDEALMQATGTVDDRKAAARLSASELADVAFIARASFNRARAKVRAIESSLMTLQSELRHMKDAGA